MGRTPGAGFRSGLDLIEGVDVMTAQISDSVGYRDRHFEQPLWPSSSASQGEIEQWISKTFRRVYD
jgi:hypothetical protein